MPLSSRESNNAEEEQGGEKSSSDCDCDTSTNKPSADTTDTMLSCFRGRECKGTTATIGIVSTYFAPIGGSVDCDGLAILLYGLKRFRRST
jgi:hypothetical protein